MNHNFGTNQFVNRIIPSFSASQQIRKSFLCKWVLANANNEIFVH